MQLDVWTRPCGLRTTRSGEPWGRAMETVRVDISYRPLRIGWAIRSGDLEAFRRAVRLSHALWGGRYNPIIFADREQDVRRLMELFRVDLVWPLFEDDNTAKQLQAQYSHLQRPFFHDALFVGGGGEPKRAQALDVLNALVHLRDSPEWRAIKDRGLRVYTWQPNDPLGDVFLMQFGQYPSGEETGTDFREAFIESSGASTHEFAIEAPISGETQHHATIAYLSRHGLRRHYSIGGGWGWSMGGFFVGDASNLEDLVCYWNLRAADIRLWFVDPNHLGRYSEVLPQWEKSVRQVPSRRGGPDGEIGVWSRRPEEALTRLPLEQVIVHPVHDATWNGRNVTVPMMHFKSVSTLGVVGGSDDPRISFALPDKPFSADPWFNLEHLVASVRLFGLYGDDQHTVHLPYIPELNEFFAREMYGEYNKLRVEPERIGLVIDAADSDSWISAIRVSRLTERLLEMAGCRSKPSPAGLIVRQLLRRIGGVQGARAFKIPGVRRLLRQHGPTATFTRKGALQLIGGKDPSDPLASFSDPDDLLFIDGKRVGKEFQPPDVFAHLVSQGIFRIGAELVCPACQLRSWVALDALKQRLTCELCGEDYDATPQLVNVQWHYRRSGLLGVQRDAQGAVPVALTLQQLDTNLRNLSNHGFYSPSLEVEFSDDQGKCECEVDFIWAIPGRYPDHTAVVLGECKDHGPIDADGIGNLGRLAVRLPPHRFVVYVLLAKLAPFTQEEIEAARKLNTGRERRAILLTNRELDPYRIYARIEKQFGLKGYGSTPEDLAQTTERIYFANSGRPEGGQ
jgi:hypothetical protein